MNFRVYETPSSFTTFMDTARDWSFEVEVSDEGTLMVYKIFTTGYRPLVAAYSPTKWAIYIETSLDAND